MTPSIDSWEIHDARGSASGPRRSRIEVKVSAAPEGDQGRQRREPLDRGLAIVVWPKDGPGVRGPWLSLFPGPRRRGVDFSHWGCQGRGQVVAGRGRSRPLGDLFYIFLPHEKHIFFDLAM